MDELTRRFKFAQMPSSDSYFDEFAQSRAASNDEGTALGGTPKKDALEALQLKTKDSMPSEDFFLGSTTHSCEL